MRFLDYKDLRAKGYPWGKCQLWRLVKAGKFPKPIKLGNRNAWAENIIDDHMTQLVRASQEDAA